MTESTPTSDHLDRSAGALPGLAAGDALGDDSAEAWALLEAQGQMEGSAWHGDHVFTAATRRLAPRADDPLVRLLGAAGAAGGASDPTRIDPVVVAAAASFAIQQHRDQLRKGTTKPYWTHLAAVAGLVAEHGGSSQQVAAAWLHDVVEDCGGRRLLREVRGIFGPEVAEMVEALSDSTVEDRADKLPWRARKEAYIGRLRAHVGETSMLVSLADKLHNAESIVADLDDPSVGVAVFDRFRASASETAWQYEQLLEAFRADPSLPAAMLSRLAHAVGRISSSAAGVG